MDRLFLLLLCVVLATGCESLEDRAAKWDSNEASDRVDAASALEESVRREEEDRREAGGEVSADALAALAKLALRSQLPDGDRDPAVRAACLAALGRSSQWRDAELFQRSLSDPAWRCRWEAVHALRLKKARQAIPSVVELLKRSSELPVRLEAIAFLRELRAREAIPVLVEIVMNLLDRNEGATAAWLALRELTGQEFSSENFLAWRKWYEGYQREGGSQESPSGVKSIPESGKGSEGARPAENK